MKFYSQLNDVIISIGTVSGVHGDTSGTEIRAGSRSNVMPVLFAHFLAHFVTQSHHFVPYGLLKRSTFNVMYQ